MERQKSVNQGKVLHQNNEYRDQPLCPNQTNTSQIRGGKLNITNQIISVNYSPLFKKNIYYLLSLDTEGDSAPLK